MRKILIASLYMVTAFTISILVIITFTYIPKDFTEPEVVPQEVQIYQTAYDSLREIGWTPYAAHIIAGVQAGVYDESNTKEWEEYNAYLED